MLTLILNLIARALIASALVVFVLLTAAFAYDHHYAHSVVSALGAAAIAFVKRGR
jgi:hypothetical protein